MHRKVSCIDLIYLETRAIILCLKPSRASFTPWVDMVYEVADIREVLAVRAIIEIPQLLSMHKNNITCL